jgi:hypothetical protein
VERCFGTLQDRLVKELRLEGIDAPEAGNAFLPGFLAKHIARFAKAPLSDRDAHRALMARDDLDEVFAWKPVTPSEGIWTSITVGGHIRA